MADFEAEMEARMGFGRSMRLSGSNQREDALVQSIATFDPNRLRHTDTAEKVILPSARDIEMERQQRSVMLYMNGGSASDGTASMNQ